VTSPTRADCLARDQGDSLAPLRDQFDLQAIDEQSLIYLDGNSLGVLPKATAARVQQVITDEWGRGLIRSWNRAEWITLSRRIGDKIAPLIGAREGEVVVADSTSVNLYKVLDAALSLATPATSKRRILSEHTNFPSDLYIADTIARAHGLELTRVDADALESHFDRAAIVMLAHVNYRTGRLHPLAEINRAAHRAGAIVIWDLAHSAGAVPIDLHGDGSPDAAADFAVGCGYKYLNGGPGAPAFAWAHPRHTAAMDRAGWRQPLSGWLGHAAPFEFAPDYRPAPGIARFACGTPPIVSLAALECGVDTVLAAADRGGPAAIRGKSIALTELFIELVESRCHGHELTLASPRDPDRRGSHVAFAHATHGYEIVQALIERGVIGDFRAPDILRFGFTPLYTRFVDVWDAVDRLARVLESDEWRDARFRSRGAVT
jgi:kynureninase